MNSSPFKELFGESCKSNVLEPSCMNKLNEEKKAQAEKTTKPSIKSSNDSRNLLAFYLSVIVVCLTFLTSVWYVNAPSEDLHVAPEVKSARDFDPSVSSDNHSESTLLDSFVSDFIGRNYKVRTLGSFAYLYEDPEENVQKNGLISMGDGFTHFQSGKLTFFDTGGNFKVLWDRYERKHVVLKDEAQYFLVTNFSDFYHRHYLGQHILEDFVNDYLRNRDFIHQLDENVWSWEWSFYTPIKSTQKHSINSEVFVDLDSGYISEIKLFDDDAEVCVFVFEFEPLEEDFDINHELLDYDFVDLK